LQFVHISLGFDFVFQFDLVLKDYVLDKLARYDEGSLTAGIMRMSVRNKAHC